jgi:hypothetical protein
MSTTTQQALDRSEPDHAERIAIVGGGITGLFCAYVLASNGCAVEVFESSDLLGGRIRSFLLNRVLLDNCEKNSEHHGGQPQSVEHHAIIDNLTVNKGEFENLEFCAEFGPMRVELDVQVLLKLLLDHLGIGALPNQEAKTPRQAAHREPFPAFSSPASDADPLYQLRSDEDGKNALELLSLAISRAVVHTSIDPSEVSADDKKKFEDYDYKWNRLITSLRNAAAVQEPSGPIFDKWAKTLREDDYWVIQRYGRIAIGDDDNPLFIPLYTMGFWNLMANYLSHNALTKVRDLGTFYHLLSENPNAAEWLTWWLRALSISRQLQGIYGGMQTITKNLLDDKMNYKNETCTVTGPAGTTITIPVHLKAPVGSIRKGPDGLSLKTASGLDSQTKFSRVILALPKAPAQELVAASPDLKSASNERSGNDRLSLPKMLDSAFGFPMVKVFFVVHERWWEEAKRANWFATRFPTREVHYWKSRASQSRRGMVMLYTDRPASSFWANYVPPGRQDDVEELCPNGKGDDQSRKVLRARLKQRLVQYINENNVPDITAEDIIWCGIMDWGRLPYGAGNHAWRPERKYWETMADLADITLGSGSDSPHVHVCGEAYSDYHGFIEGSLRSATYTLTKILKRHKADTAETLKRILCVLGVNAQLLSALDDQTKSQSPKTRDRDYLEDLKSWVDNLDKC